MSEPPRLGKPKAATLGGLREALVRAGYTGRGVRRALGPRPPVRRTRREVHLRSADAAGDLGTLVRLFRLREPTDADRARAALAPAPLDDLLAAGLLEEDGAAVWAPVELTPYQDMFFFHDRMDASERPPAWHVGLGSASRTLASLTIRRPVARALDLGTGCGIQALLASRHAEHVVATDLGERPLLFTELNVKLNGIENVECRHGDLFAPVAGERFGLVVSNPPFVVSPDSELLFRDSEKPGDELTRDVLGAVGEHLEEGGHATILCSWIAPPEGHWSDPLRAWIAPDSDALLLQFTSANPLAYAAMWTDELERWLDYYEREGIEWISTGAAVLRRRSGGNRIVALQATGAPRENAGEQFLRIFAAQDDVEQHGEDDERLRSLRFALVEHRLRQEASFRGGGYEVELTGVEIPGSPLNARVELEAIHALPRLEGAKTVAEVAAEAARESGLDPDAVERATLTTVRRLYGRGFLELRS